MTKPEDLRVGKYLEAKSCFGKITTEHHAGGAHFKCQCPFCGKANHLYVNKSTSMWDCKSCGEVGNLTTLKKRLGDIKDLQAASGVTIDLSQAKPRENGQRGTGKLQQGIAEDYHARLLARNDPAAVSAWKWLTDLDGQRGFDERTIKHFKLGVRTRDCGKSGGSTGGRRRLGPSSHGDCVDCGGTGSITFVTIPFYQGNVLVNIKSRAIAPAKKTWRREKGCPSTLFSFDTLDMSGKNPLIIMEGEWDVMAMYQLGFSNVTTFPTGASGRLQDDWSDQMASVEKIILCYDNDGAGRSGAERVALDLGRHRCWLATIPAKDANELLLLDEDQAIQEIEEAFRKAKGFMPSSLIQSTDLRDEIKQDLDDPDRYYGISTGWPSVDELVGGIRPELTLVTGHSGSGKTTFTNALAGNLVQAGYPGLVAPFESRVKPGILKMLRRISRCDPGSDEGRVKFNRAFDTLERWPLFWLNHYGTLPLIQLYETLRYAVVRLGIKFVVLDHLRFFVHLQKEDRDEWQASRRTLQRLVEWAEELKLAIILVAHPKSGDNEQSRIQMTDLMGGAATWQIPEAIWSIHVPRNKDRSTKGEPVSVFTSLKSRADVGKEGRAILKFDPNSQTYTDPASEPAVIFGR